MHSTFSGAPWLRELDREPRVVMNPADGAARHIVDGNWVRVFNDRGYVVLRAWLTQTVSAWHGVFEPRLAIVRFQSRTYSNTHTRKRKCDERFRTEYFFFRCAGGNQTRTGG